MVQTTTPFVLMAFGKIQRWWQWRRAKWRAAAVVGAEAGSQATASYLTQAVIPSQASYHGSVAKEAPARTK